MARGDDCKTASRANQACKQFDVTAPFKKPMANPPAIKQEEKKKDYGSWGPIFKDKKNFTEMHLC
ncbi:hypothetical protein RR46_11581 [Papilio xuthus]|uniref:Uncharacterized protein n=1 Tax=Papilio xuthus TaxID=66420 RepID=A0A194PSC4_PAPXU|nr:hypothetical protein RR46_11581 [Papilio xuthus]